MAKLLNVKQLAEASGMSRATIYRAVQKKLLPAPQKIDGAAFWEVRRVREALARRRRLLLA